MKFFLLSLATKILIIFLGVIFSPNQNVFSATKTNVFENNSSFVFYYRASEVAEITGNEDTFLTYFNLNVSYQHSFSFTTLTLKTDGDFILPLNLKGRVHESMTPPAYFFNSLYLKVVLDAKQWGRHQFKL